MGNMFLLLSVHNFCFGFVHLKLKERWRPFFSYISVYQMVRCLFKFRLFPHSFGSLKGNNSEFWLFNLAPQKHKREKLLLLPNNHFLGDFSSADVRKTVRVRSFCFNSFRKIGRASCRERV